MGCILPSGWIHTCNCTNYCDYNATHNYVNSSCNSSHLKNCRCESSLNGLTPYSHCTGAVPERYRDRDWCNRKQWVLVPVLVSDHCEHFHMVLYFPFCSCTDPSTVSMQCEYTIRLYLMYTDFAFVLAQ